MLIKLSSSLVSPSLAAVRGESEQKSEKLLKEKHGSGIFSWQNAAQFDGISFSRTKN